MRVLPNHGDIKFTVASVPKAYLFYVLTKLSGRSSKSNSSSTNEAVLFSRFVGRLPAEGPPPGLGSGLSDSLFLPTAMRIRIALLASFRTKSPSRVNASSHLP